MKGDSVERITNLLLCFKEAKIPLTLKQVTELVDGYPSYEHAFNTCRQVFMRDKQALKDYGYDLKTVPVDTIEKFGYELEDHRNELSNLILTEEESKIVSLVLNILKNGVPSAKSEGSGIGLDFDQIPLSVFDLSSVIRLNPRLSHIYTAVVRKKKFLFEYLGKPREVLPLKVFFRAGTWYLLGYDLSGKQNKFFKINKMRNPSVSSTKLTKAELKILEERSSDGHELSFFSDANSEKITVKCTVDERLADSIISEFGHNLVLNYEENRLVIEFETVESEYLYSQILKFGTGIKILEPQTLIDQLCDYFCNYIENKK